MSQAKFTPNQCAVNGEVGGWAEETKKRRDLIELRCPSKPNALNKTFRINVQMPLSADEEMLHCINFVVNNNNKCKKPSVL